MRCPNCNTQLKMAARQGVEIDYCPQCQGVWLDRGELDKIVARSNSSQSMSHPSAPLQERHMTDNKPGLNRRKQREPFRRDKSNDSDELFDIGGLFDMF